MVVKYKFDGSSALMGLFKSGQMFGEIAAFSNQIEEWPSTVIANTDACVMLLPTNNILEICQSACKNHRTLIKNLITYISNRGLRLIKRVEILTIKSLRVKLAIFLLQQYKKAGKQSFILAYNRSQMADYLGVTRPALSKEMASMKRQGIIDYYKSSIKILDLQRLNACLIE